MAMPDKILYFADILKGTNRGRLDESLITYSERGNLQGMQFHAVAGLAYENAQKAGLGNEVPTEWFLQNIKD